MSILLDALKKSEQQRELGNTPTLQTSVEGQSPSNATLNHWIPLSLMALSACVMAWFGWQQFRTPEPGNDPAVPIEVAQTAVESHPRTMTERFQSNSEGGEEALTPDDKARLNQSFNDFTADNDEAETAAPEPEVVTARLRQSRAESVEPAVGPGQSELEPHVSEPISYWELPQGVRDNLPEIKITVLVYSDIPDDRFLLTNGQRMAEKDELQNGLVLDEIRRDGAIFLYRKYRFLVKG